MNNILFTLRNNYEQVKSNHYVSEKWKSDKMAFFYVLYRYISFWPTAVLLMMSVTANQVTSISVMLSLGSCYFFLQGDLISGSILFFIAVICDQIDGNIARITNSACMVGSVIDSLADLIICFVIFAFSFGISKNTIDFFSFENILFLGLASGFLILFRTHYLSIFSNILAVHSKNLPSSKNIKTKKSKLWFLKGGFDLFYSGIPVFIFLFSVLGVAELFIFILTVALTSVICVELPYNLRRIKDF